VLHWFTKDISSGKGQSRLIPLRAKDVLLCNDKKNITRCNMKGRAVVDYAHVGDDKNMRRESTLTSLYIYLIHSISLAS